LEPIATPVRFQFEDSFRPLTEVSTGRYLSPDEFEGSSDELDDAALLIDEHHILDITEVVRQNIWLSRPMYPSCNWTGAGVCPNWLAYQQEVRAEYPEIDVDAGVDEGTIDPRWEALLKLRQKRNDDE
jgi:uncharacterized metal-binding protein YceD (DUF177 family)